MRWRHRAGLVHVSGRASGRGRRLRVSLRRQRLFALLGQPLVLLRQRLALIRWQRVSVPEILACGFPLLGSQLRQLRHPLVESLLALGRHVGYLAAIWSHFRFRSASNLSQSAASGPSASRCSALNSRQLGFEIDRAWAADAELPAAAAPGDCAAAGPAARHSTNTPRTRPCIQRSDPLLIADHHAEAFVGIGIDRRVVQQHRQVHIGVFRDRLLFMPTVNVDETDRQGDDWNHQT